MMTDCAIGVYYYPSLVTKLEHADSDKLCHRHGMSGHADSDGMSGHADSDKLCHRCGMSGHADSDKLCHRYGMSGHADSNKL